MRLVLGLRDGALVLGPALPQLDGPLQHGGLGAEHPLVLPLGACRRTRSVTSRRVASLWRPLERSGALWRSWRCCDSALNSPRGRFTHRNPCAMRHAPYRVRDATLNGAPFGSAAPQGGFYTKALPDGSTRVTGPANYSGTWLADNGARTAPGRSRLRRDWAPLPHLHRDWAHPCHICVGTGLTPTAARLRRAFASLPRRISTGCDGGNTLVALVAMMVEPRASRWARPYVALGNKELPCGASVDASSLSFGVKQGQVGSAAAPGARHGSATHCGATSV